MGLVHHLLVVHRVRVAKNNRRPRSVLLLRVILLKFFYARASILSELLLSLEQHAVNLDALRDFDQHSFSLVMKFQVFTKLRVRAKENSTVVLGHSATAAPSSLIRF